MDLFLTILILAILLAVALWASPAAYWHFYRRAEARDLAWSRAHPDCTWAEAHRHRERVRRLFLRP